MFDLTNIFDLISDPLSRRRLEKDLDQEVKERVLGDEAKPIKQAVVLEVMSPSAEQSDNPKNSNEQYFSIKARIENLHECLPDPVEFIKQKRTNGEINKLIDMSRVIYSLNPVNSPNNNQTTPIPKIGDVVELIEVSKNVYRFNNKISTIQDLVGFTKNTDPNESGSRASINPNSTEELYNNGTEYTAGSDYVPPPEGLSGTVADQAPVYEALNWAAAGNYTRKTKDQNGNVKYVSNQGLPCTGYVAIWVLNQLGLIPQKEKQKTMDGWSAMDVDLWKTINIANKNQGLGDTTNIDAIQKRLGGSTKSFTDFSKTFPKGSAGPELTAGRWHIAQKWRENNSGHIFLIFWDGGDNVRILDSSHANKHRDKTLKKSYWWGDGWSPITIYKILTLPELK